MITPTERRIIQALFATATILILGIIFMLPLSLQSSILKRPLGSPIALGADITATYRPQPSWTPKTPTSSPEPEASPTIAPTPLPEATLRPTPEPVCGAPEVVTILLIGSDTRSNNYLYGLADVVRVARVDFVNGRITILEFPRDLWVEIPGISQHENITHGKLNQAYLYGNPGFGYYDGPGEGPGLLARTLLQNFGVESNNFVAINMQTFVRLVDALGGIRVNLAEGVDARAEDQPERYDLVFRAGLQTLDGREALTLARLRPVTIAQRIRHQNEILCGLRDKLLSPSVLPKIPDIISVFEGSVQTDLTPELIGQISCLALQPESPKIVFTSFPQDLLVGTRIYDPYQKLNTFVYDVDFDILRNYVRQFSEGTWPENPESDPTRVTDENAYACP